MIRKRYHFEILENNRIHFQTVVKDLTGDIVTPTITTNIKHKTIYSYFVSLSKYELLYLRLVSSGGKFVNVDEWEQNSLV